MFFAEKIEVGFADGLFGVGQAKMRQLCAIVPQEAAQPIFVLTVSTGTVLCRTTYSATLPRSRCANAERPWVPIRIIWQLNSNAASTIVGRGDATHNRLRLG